MGSTTLTTMHLNEERKVAEMLDIPEGITQIALLPVGYTKGTDSKRANRRRTLEQLVRVQFTGPAERSFGVQSGPSCCNRTPLIVSVTSFFTAGIPAARHAASPTSVSHSTTVAIRNDERSKNFISSSITSSGMSEVVT